MDTLGVAVVGFGWMGQVHARAYQRVPHHFPDVSLVPQLILVADSAPDRRADAQSRYRFEQATGDWHDVLADERVQAVSVTAPNFLHREIGTAVAAAGKHLWIEKPVGLTATDAQTVADAVAASGVQSTVGFNYRNAPAVEHARELIASGAIGRVTNLQVRLLSDYAAHPHGALSWRFEAARGGSGVAGDLVSHGVDLVHYLLDNQIVEVIADTAIFIERRPIPTGVGSHFAVAEGGELGVVENDDYLACLARVDGGARACIESSRVSVGDQCTYGFVAHGTKGYVSWDFRRMGELEISTGDDYVNQTASTLFVGPRHGDYGAFHPGGGIAMGYDDLKVIEAARFLTSIATRKPHGATIADAVAMARVLDAITESAQSRQWTAVG